MADELAEKLVDEGRIDDAVARFEALLEAAENPAYRLRIASLLFNQGKIGDALAHARRAADPPTAADTGADQEHRADAVLLLGYCLRNLKRFREASKSFQQFAASWPDSPRARIARFSAALCLEELDDWSGAIEVYRELRDDEADFRLAICLERAGRIDESAQLFESFLTRHEDSPEMLKVRFRLGSMRIRQGRIDEDIKHLEETIRLGGETFIGQLAGRLIERARVKANDISKKLRSYS